MAACTCAMAAPSPSLRSLSSPPWASPPPPGPPPGSFAAMHPGAPLHLSRITALSQAALDGGAATQPATLARLLACGGGGVMVGMVACSQAGGGGRHHRGRATRLPRPPPLPRCRHRRRGSCPPARISGCRPPRSRRPPTPRWCCTGSPAECPARRPPPPHAPRRPPVPAWRLAGSCSRHSLQSPQVRSRTPASSCPAAVPPALAMPYKHPACAGHHDATHLMEPAGFHPRRDFRRGAVVRVDAGALAGAAGTAVFSAACGVLCRLGVGHHLCQLAAIRPGRDVGLRPHGPAGVQRPSALPCRCSLL